MNFVTIKYILVFISFSLLSFCFPELTENLNLNLFDSKLEQSLDDLKLNIDINSNYSFKHGVASGDPTVDSVILWTRITPSHILNKSEDSVPLFVSISEFANFESSRTYSVLTNKNVDYTVKVDMKFLKPDTKYYYFFTTLTGDSSRIGYTKTLPTEDAVLKSLSFSVHSCSNYANGFFTAYAMAPLKKSVDYVIHLGDYIYEYQNGYYTDGTKLNRTHFPNKELFELDDYRQRYASYHEDKDLQLSHGDYPWILVWDDHEVADNSWLRGSVKSRGFDFLKRKQYATQAYFEWLPIRPQNNDNVKIWRHLNFGKLLALFMIDTRHYSRDVTDTYDNADYISSIANKTERTMMGFDQEYWLYNSLLESDSIWKFIGSQTVVNHVSFESISEVIGKPFEVMNYDSFDGYTANRDRFIDTIVNNNIQDVILLSGDFHISWVHEIFNNINEYNMETGEGSVLVEFAVTATSSPTTFPKDYSVEQCYELSELLVSGNTGVIWNEGWFRGYTEVTATENNVTAKYYGVDTNNPEREEFLLATFIVDQGTNKLRREFYDAVKYGYIDQRVL
ncbi:hypothetical protein B5S33_g2596 [[Candida] boidinii]|nr:hypothetical protein B5S33_g2596 [[Candida] boidinii]